MSTGEQISTRSRAHAMRLPISAASSGPRPGQKNGRTRTGLPVVGRVRPVVSKRPLLSRWRGRFQRSSKSRRYAAATTRARRRVTMQFSCSVNESSVQFIEPVQTRSPSITTYLWCISVPKPITGRTSRPSESMYSGGAAGRGTLSGTSRVRLALVVVEDAHAHAAVAQALQRARR